MRAEKDEVVRLLKTARGHIDGILRMIDENRYCMDISHQLFAVEAIIRKANKTVLLAHMQTCVMDSAKTGDYQKKIDELTSLMESMMK